MIALYVPHAQDIHLLFIMHELFCKINRIFFMMYKHNLHDPCRTNNFSKAFQNFLFFFF
jgi:hypothetical protein